MKAVILAGGLGTRLSEETTMKPKPMVEVGNKPILWHIMKIYSAHGINDFIVCCGYKKYIIKDYFLNYFIHQSDITIDLQNNNIDIHNKKSEPWKVTLVDTGMNTMTGGRLKRVAEYLQGEDCFCFTYGDGVSDVNISSTIEFHKKHNQMATITAVQPSGRYGALKLNNEQVTGFMEKPKGDGGWINGGFFVLSPKVIDLVEDDTTFWEREPLEHLAENGQLSAYKHDGFWHAMDTIRDKEVLNNLWNKNSAPWKIW